MELRLTQHRNFLALHEFEIDLVTQPGFAWSVGEAIRINLNLLDQAMPPGFMAQ